MKKKDEIFNFFTENSLMICEYQFDDSFFLNEEKSLVNYFAYLMKYIFYFDESLIQQYINYILNNIGDQRYFK